MQVGQLMKSLVFHRLGLQLTIVASDRRQYRLDEGTRHFFKPRNDLHVVFSRVDTVFTSQPTHLGHFGRRSKQQVNFVLLYKANHPQIPYEHIPKDTQFVFPVCFLKDVAIRQSRRFQQVFQNILGLDEDEDLMPVIHQTLGDILIQVKMSGMAHLNEDIHVNRSPISPSNQGFSFY